MEQIGKYQLRKVLGKGASGTVYLALERGGLGGKSFLSDLRTVSHRSVRRLARLDACH